jgi:hypothetical protein
MLGGFSAVLILGTPGNIQPDFGNAEFNLDINMTTGVIENVNFSLPVNITNAGYYDLENLDIDLNLVLNYSHIDYPAPGLNETREVLILEHSLNFETILKGTTGNLIFSATNNSFIHANFPDPLTEVDWLRGPPALEFYGNFTISLDYSLGMHSLSITLVNIALGGYP